MSVSRRLVPTLLLLLGPFAGAEASSVVSYGHTATGSNISGPNGQYTELDHPFINDDPNARLLVTQNWNPNGSPGIYNDHVVGVIYFDSFSGGGNWFIQNENGDAIPEGASFNVLIMGPGSLSFVHHTTDGNSAGRASTLDPIDPDCLLCPGGTLMLHTHTFTAFGIPGSSFDFHSSLRRGSPSYFIATESRIPGFSQPMPTGVFFNVLIADSPGIASSPGTAYQHLATVGNIVNNYTLLSHPELVGAPQAIVFAVRAGPPEAPVSPHEIGVWYTGSEWSIFFQDQASLDVDSYYNVYIPPMMSDGFESGDLSWWSSTSP